MIYFLDTSAFVKYYHQEIGSETIIKIIDNNNKISISQLAIIEFYSTIAKKYREKVIDSHLQKEIYKVFEHDLKQKYTIQELMSKHYKKGKDIIRKYGNDYGVKTLDSLHLATILLMRKEKEIIFVSCDKKLLRICNILKIKILNPERAAIT